MKSRTLFALLGLSFAIASQAQSPPPPLKITMKPATGGIVALTSSGYKMTNCVSPLTCTAEANAPAKLTATPSKDYKFGNWTGICSGTEPVCEVKTSGQVGTIFIRTTPLPPRPGQLPGK